MLRRPPMETHETPPEPPIRVAVLGARGRVGSEICRAVAEAPDLELVAPLGRGDSLELLVTSRAHVAVDFTEPGAAAEHLTFFIDHGIHGVVGTTGLPPHVLADAEARLAKAPGVGLVLAPNFALGAVLAMRFAEQAAAWFESVELIELHHPHKKDAPSGTALDTAARMAAARSRSAARPSPDATDSGLDAARGASIDGIRVHSVRLSGLLSHQEALFGNPGEVLTIRHDSLDRSSFVSGVLLAVRRVRKHPGVTWGLEKLLGL